MAAPGPYGALPIVCPTCRTTVFAPPGAPVIQCGVCRNLVSVAPPPGAPAYGQAPAYPPPHMGAPSPQMGAPPPQMGAPPMMGPGRKKALIIGIAYRGTANQLNGCINDANCMKYMLTKRMMFPESDILFMTDDQHDPLLQPTRHNILQGMRWLVGDARPGDSLFFHFSGHGGQSRDPTGEEIDGMNETLLPLDFRTAGQIVDDDINRILVNPLPPGVRLHAVVDACHSGTVLDLPFQWRGFYGSGWEDQRRYTYKGTAGGEAIAFSGCDDNQTSADTTALSKNTATGAMTFAFIQAIESGQGATYSSLMNSMRNLLKSGPGGGPAPGGPVAALQGGALTSMLLGGAYSLLGGGRGGSSGGFTQIPQLTASAPFDLNRPFVL